MDLLRRLLKPVLLAIAAYLSVVLYFITKLDAMDLVAVTVDPPASISYRELIPVPVPRRIMEWYTVTFALDRIIQINDSFNTPLTILYAARSIGDKQDLRRNETIFLLMGELLGRGYHINKENAYGCTVLNYAEAEKDVEFVTYLVTRGAVVNPNCALISEHKEHS